MDEGKREWGLRGKYWRYEHWNGIFMRFFQRVKIVPPSYGCTLALALPLLPVKFCGLWSGNNCGYGVAPVRLGLYSIAGTLAKHRRLFKSVLSFLASLQFSAPFSWISQAGNEVDGTVEVTGTQQQVKLKISTFFCWQKLILICWAEPFGKACDLILLLAKAQNQCSTFLSRFIPIRDWAIWKKSLQNQCYHSYRLSHWGKASS